MDESASLLKRARDLFQQGLQGQAEAVVDQLLRDNPRDVTALDFRGYLLYSRGSLEDALAAYGRLAELEPGVPGHLANLGLIGFKARRYADALRAFERLLELKPGDTKALRNLGFCHERLGDPGQAIDCFSRAGDQKEAERIREQFARASTSAVEFRGGAGAAGTVSTDQETDIAAWLAGATLPRSGQSPSLVRAGPGEILIRVRGKVFVNPAFCVGHRGVVVFAPASREAEKASAKFGVRHGVLARTEGNGELVLSGLGRGLQTLRMSGGRLCVNWSSLVLCADAITVSFEHTDLVKEAFLATGLEGSGPIVLALRGSPVVLPVAPDSPILVRPEAVVAWTEGLGYEAEAVPELKKLVGKHEALRYRFEGTGHIVLQSC